MNKEQRENIFKIVLTVVLLVVIKILDKFAYIQNEQVLRVLYIVPYLTVGDESVITKKYIEVGLENEEISEIVSGIDKNDKIVATWTSDLAEGTTVTINKVEEVVDEVEVR